jgi:hypothetical protein
MSAEPRDRVSFLRAARWPLIAVPVCWGLQMALAALTEGDGLLMPETTLDLGIGLLALLVLTLRVAATVLVPAGLAYVIVMRFAPHDR